MSTVVALILWFAVTSYAVFGGADYGAGFWDLTAGGARRGTRSRALIDHAMAPVWEANNVWLIFALVVLWTRFPRAFAAIMSTLYLPMALAAAGIVLRGGICVSRIDAGADRTPPVRCHLRPVVAGDPVLPGRELRCRSPRARVQAGDSGAEARLGLVRPDVDPGRRCWPSPSAAFLSAVFLVFDARRVDDTLDRHFRWRAIGSGVAPASSRSSGCSSFAATRRFCFTAWCAEGSPSC